MPFADPAPPRLIPGPAQRAARLSLATMPSPLLIAALCRRAAFAFALALPLFAAAQNPAPAPRTPARKVLLRGGTIHVGDGKTVIENGLVGISDDRIVYAGPAAGYDNSLAGAEVIDVTGQQVYPGLILANSSLG